MSSFYCERCGKAIIDTPQGYISSCKHYKIEEVGNYQVDINGDSIKMSIS